MGEGLFQMLQMQDRCFYFLFPAFVESIIRVLVFCDLHTITPSYDYASGVAILELLRCERSWVWFHV